MTDTEIISILNQIAASPELTRRLADIVCSQLCGWPVELQVAPSADDTEMSEIVRRAQERERDACNLVTIDGHGICIDQTSNSDVLVGPPGPMDLENYHLSDDVRIDSTLFECGW